METLLVVGLGFLVMGLIMAKSGVLTRAADRKRRKAP